jgi:transmembrane sensor
MRTPENTLHDDESRAAMARGWIVRLASGDMTADEVAKCKAWIEGHPDNRATFERERELWQGLEAAQAAFTPDAVNVVMFRRRSMLQGARRHAIAVGGLVAASLAFVIFGYTPAKIALTADHATETGQQRHVNLPDGSRVTLNTDSAIAVHYSADERRIDLLRGEAYFNVEPNADRPFRVTALDGVSRAVGTAFSVRKAGHQVTTIVSHGVVAVTSPSASSNEVTARPGDRVTYRAGAEPKLAGRVDENQTLSWRHGRVSIEGVAFADAIAEMDRYRPGRIVILNAPRTAKPVSAIFAIDQVDSAVTGLAATQGLTVSRFGSLLILH